MEGCCKEEEEGKDSRQRSHRNWIAPTVMWLLLDAVAVALRTATATLTSCWWDDG